MRRSKIAEAGHVPLTHQNTSGMTFGFEFEFIVLRDWYVTNDSNANSIKVDSIQAQEFAEYFYFNERLMSSSFAEWRDDYDAPDATLQDWFDDVGVSAVIEEIGAEPNDTYFLKGDLIYEAGQSQSDVLWLLGEKLGEAGVTDEEPRVFHDAKMQDKDFQHWYIEPDSTVHGDDRNGEYDAELTSPIFDDFDAFLGAIRNVFAWIQKDPYGDQVGYTNSSCGFHVNIGVPPGATPDFAKMAVFIGERYLHKLFGANRLEQIGSFRQKFATSGVDLKSAQFDEVVSALNAMFRNLSDKHFIFNPLPYFEGKGYVEFRAIGGANYEKNFEIVVSNINRFVFLMRLACDPNMYRREYMQKVYAWLGADTSADTKKDLVERQLLAYLKSINIYQPMLNKIVDANGNLIRSETARDTLLQSYASLWMDKAAAPTVIFKDALVRMGLSRGELEKWHNNMVARWPEYADSWGATLAAFRDIR